jgi:hypothetical protein
MESFYWFLHGKNYEETYHLLNITDKMDLCALIINERYNHFLSLYCDYKDNEFPINKNILNGKPHNKRLPYIGWYWRNLNFADKKIPIGFDEYGYVGFMVSNKWGYPERHLTHYEVEKLISIIDDAMRINEEGDDLKNLNHRKMEAIEAIYPWIQSLTLSLKNEGKK